jgi:rubrerythrin
MVSPDHDADGAAEQSGEDEPNGKGGRTGVSRRAMLAGSAGAVLAAASPLALSSVRAQSDERSDVDILNFALTLEHLENEFYIQQLDKFGEREFQRSDLLDEFGFGMRFTARDYLRVIQEHEQAHVDFLITAIEEAGGDPVSPASEYNFGAPLGKDGIDTVVEFATVAQALEATGVDAYAGAAPSISNPDYIPPALSIHSVEANHAAYLRNLNGNNPMPAAFNEAKPIDEVLGIVDPIIVEE